MGVRSYGVGSFRSNFRVRHRTVLMKLFQCVLVDEEEGRAQFPICVVYEDVSSSRKLMLKGHNSRESSASSWQGWRGCIEKTGNAFRKLQEEGPMAHSQPIQPPRAEQGWKPQLAVKSCHSAPANVICRGIFKHARTRIVFRLGEKTIGHSSALRLHRARSKCAPVLHF